jgi:hypothetical protein
MLSRTFGIQIIRFKRISWINIAIIDGSSCCSSKWHENDF